MYPTFPLVVVAIVRNEASYVEEWIAYHHLLGAGHFVIYDNDSDDDLRTSLRPYVNHGLVTLVDWPMPGGQVPAYRHAAHFFGPSARWLAPLDLDEFIVPKVDADIISMLDRLEREHGADRVVLPWRNFGMGGEVERRPGLVISRFRLAEDVPPDGFGAVACKAIVRTEAITSMNRHAHAINSDRTVDARGERCGLVAGRIARPDFSAGQINHYVTKSQAELVAKIARGDVNRELTRTPVSAADEEGFSTPDGSVDRFVHPTERALAELRLLAPEPLRYGSRVELREPHLDPFMRAVILTVSNFTHGMRRARNGTKPVENLAAGTENVFIARVTEARFADQGPLTATPHWADLLRRLGATMRWQGGPADLTAIEMPLDDGGFEVHTLIAATVMVDPPTRVVLTVDGVVERTIELPANGRFALVAEVNARAARVSEIGLRASSLVSVSDLAVCTYG